MSGTVNLSYPILPFETVKCAFFPTTFLEIRSCMLNGYSAGSARGFCQRNKVELDLRNHSQQIKSTRTYQQTEVQVSGVKDSALELVTNENAHWKRKEFTLTS